MCIRYRYYTHRNIDEGHTSHQHICRIPCKACAELGAYKDYGHCQESVAEHESFIAQGIFVYVADVHFCIEIIAYQSGICKQRQSSSDEISTEGAEIDSERVLDLSLIHI